MAYKKEGEYLFIAVQRPQLTVVLNADAQRPDGRPATPKYAYFHAGPFGGEFRTKDRAIAEIMRARDSKDERFVEVTDEAQLSEISRERDDYVADQEPNKVIRHGRQPKAVAPVAEPEPAREPAAPAVVPPRGRGQRRSEPVAA